MRCRIARCAEGRFAILAAFGAASLSGMGCGGSPPSDGVQVNSESRVLRVAGASTVSSIAIDAGMSQGPLMNPTAYGNFGLLAYQENLYSAADRTTMLTLGLKCVRTFLKVEQIGANYATIYPYLDDAAALSKGANGKTGDSDGCLLLSFDGEGAVSTAEGGNCVSGCLTQAQYSAQLEATLKNLKARYSGIQYVEVLNESEASVPLIASYYDFYRSSYRAVNAVNALGYPGPQMVTGGPTVTGFSGTRTQDFLTEYSIDPSPAKELGFLSHHMYWNQASPKTCAAERGAVVSWLTSRGVSAMVPQFIDELGIVPPNPPTAADYLNSAAGTFANSYYYAQDSPSATDGGNDFTAAWEIEGKLPETQGWSLMDHEHEGIFTPLGMYHQMGSMLVGPTRIFAAPSSDLLDTNGLGVNCLASTNGTDAVSVLCVNYQNKNAKTLSPMLTFENLPNALNGGARVQHWLLDSTHSNSRVSGDLTKLQQFEDAAATVSSRNLTFGPIALEPNAIELIEISAFEESSACNSAGTGVAGSSCTGGGGGNLGASSGGGGSSGTGDSGDRGGSVSAGGTTGGDAGLPDSGSGAEAGHAGGQVSAAGGAMNKTKSDSSSCACSIPKQRREPILELAAGLVLVGLRRRRCRAKN